MASHSAAFAGNYFGKNPDTRPNRVSRSPTTQVRNSALILPPDRIVHHIIAQPEQTPVSTKKWNTLLCCWNCRNTKVGTPLFPRVVATSRLLRSKCRFCRHFRPLLRWNRLIPKRNRKYVPVETSPCPKTESTHTFPLQDHGDFPLPLLPPQACQDEGKPLLVFDLDETLVHGNFSDTVEADLLFPVWMDGKSYNIAVQKRPFFDECLQRLREKFEICMFTAGITAYANEVLDNLDRDRTIRHRLFRDACTLRGGKLVKDLGRLGRDIKRTVIVDNRVSCFSLHPANGIKCTSFYGDKTDRELEVLTDFLMSIDTVQKDIRPQLREWDNESH
eukprot:gb/GECG01008801.1/.p1 GENE.gb/GECG01008801.1/~~gb/GECG01008801.1/.p1  ORF type:complete len:332 (+),score=14.79 gb/GECG01008801.1/:1-996(+)